MNIFEFVLLLPQGIVSFSQAVLDIMFFEVSLKFVPLYYIIDLPETISLWLIITGAGLVYIVGRRLLPL